MIKFSPQANITIYISEKTDGSVETSEQMVELLSKYQTDSKICYFRHHHQASRFHCRSLPPTQIQEVWADAVISDQKMTLAMKVADCFPITLISKKPQVVALIHAGWKPLLQNIVELTILDLKNDFQVVPQQLSAWIGPGIRSCCYHFLEKPIQADLQSWKNAVSKKRNYWQVDLVQFITSELIRLKVNPNLIIDQKSCTSCEKNYFFSHYQTQQNNEPAGRMIVATELK